jgi:hypothetical protein
MMTFLCLNQHGENFVYHDKWDANGDYIFSGEGRVGDQNLTARNKEIIDAEKNSELKPEGFMPNSGQKVWWKCSKGYEWQATIVNRNRGRGCPYCSGRKKEK